MASPVMTSAAAPLRLVRANTLPYRSARARPVAATQDLAGLIPLLFARDGRSGVVFRTPAIDVKRSLKTASVDVPVGSRNYGDRDKGLAPLSLCKSR
jgi:hypothetical protein